jgi:hypothetical protein
MFTEVPAVSSRGNREAEVSGKVRGGLEKPAGSAGGLQGRTADLEPWKGSQVDLLA